MASNPDPVEAYRAFNQYPLNHHAAPSYGMSVLEGHRKRLHECRDRMFITDNGKFKIPIRDVSAEGTVRKKNLFTDSELKDFLGAIPGPAEGESALSDGLSASLSKQKCRFIFLVAESTAGPLELHVRMLLRLLTFYQVPPHYLDFLYIYASDGTQDTEVHFSGFRTEKVLNNPDHATNLPTIGRSGRRHSISLNLKTVVSKSDGNWKIRQAAIHHQFDIGRGTQLWMIGDPHADLKKRIDELFRQGLRYPSKFDTMEQAFESSLNVIVTMAQWATSEWRWNVRFLEDRAEKLTLDPAIVVQKVKEESLGPDSLADLQKWEEKTNETMTAMESNVNIMILLRKFYSELVEDEYFPQGQSQMCKRASKRFAFQLDELVCETNMQIARTAILVKTVSDRKAILASKLTASAYKQANRGVIEAIAMRIVTIVTLIYLPATFSSTFFSTDVIKYGEGEKFSKLALERFLELTLPLMFLTFLFAGAWFWIELNRRR